MIEIMLTARHLRPGDVYSISLKVTILGRQKLDLCGFKIQIIIIIGEVKPVTGLYKAHYNRRKRELKCFTAEL